MPAPTILVRFQDPQAHPPADVEDDPRTVLALPHNRDRVIATSAATVAGSPTDFLCWAEIPQPVVGLFRRRSL